MAMTPGPSGPIRRTYTLEAEYRDPGTETGGDYATLSGHAAVFERQSLPLYDFWYGEYREEIAPGAFRNVLAGDPDVHLVYSHDMASTMASTRSKTLSLHEDSEGLRVVAKLDPADLDVQRVAPKMRRGDVREMSFSFTVALDDQGEAREVWTVDGNSVTRRILEFDGLYDVSVVPQGAYPQTDADLRQRELRARVVQGLHIREGKILSSASRTAIQAAVDTLQELLDSATTENGRAAATKVAELRADMPSLLALTEMWEAGCGFIACETEPDDGPDRDAMAAVLATIEVLIQGEANEDDGTEADAGMASGYMGRSREGAAGATFNRRDGDHQPSGDSTIAPGEQPAGGGTANALDVLKLRTRARMASS